MKFTSALTGRYVVGTHPDHWVQMGMSKVVEKGLHAEFHNGFFDSVDEQKRLHWTDEQRIIVEQWLLNHPDFGPAGGLELYGSEPQPAGVLLIKGTCLFPTPIEEEGVRSTAQCGRDLVDGEEFCERHLAMVQKAEVEV